MQSLRLSRLFTIINNIELLDEPLLLWRSTSQWLGGLIFLVSIIATLGNKRVKFNEEQYKKRINSIIKIFDKSFITKIQTEDNLPIKPIFILGAPRSGSTLVEQILSSHTKVFGGGELGYIKHIASGKYSDNVKTKLYPERFLDNTDEDLSFVRNDAETYLNKVQQFIDDKNSIHMKGPVSDIQDIEIK